MFFRPKVKIVISNLNQDGVSQNVAAITQHAIAEKRMGEGMVFPFLFHLFIVWLEHKAYGDAPHVL